MDRDTILWIVIAILIVLVIYVLFLQPQASSVIATGQSAGQSGSSYSGMVGGC